MHAASFIQFMCKLGAQYESRVLLTSFKTSAEVFAMDKATKQFLNALKDLSTKLTLIMNISLSVEEIAVALVRLKHY